MSFIKKSKQLLIWVAGLLAVLGAAIMAAHIFFSDFTFDPGRSFVPPASQYLNPDAKRFTIALASDTASNNLVLESVIKDISQSDANYSFVLYLGDFVKDYLADYNWMLWKISPFLKDLPMYAIPGNHDVTRRHHINKAPYRRIMGPEYYWFGYGDVLFIGIDLSDENTLDDAMIKWLADTLDNIRPQFKFCIIFGHIPPYNPISPSNFTMKHSMNPELADKFKAIVRRHKIDAMFFGHVHYWSANKFAGIPTYTLPAAGQGPRSEINKHGYVSLTIGPKGIEKIEPKYIEFSGPRASAREAWIVNNTINSKTRRSVMVLLLIISVCLSGVIIASCIERRQK